MATGSEKIEQSDVVEVLLTVTEAAVDYLTHPSKNWKSWREKAPLLFKPKSIESGLLSIASGLEEETGTDEKTFKLMTLLSC